MSKVACSACGAAILTATAEVTGGLCMPCKTGRRDAIEAGRRRLQGERARRAHPLTRHWHDLVHRVHQMPQGFAGLSEPEKLYYAVGTLDGAIYRGGFESYFFNTSGGHYEYALSGLDAIEAAQASVLLQRAKQVLFAFEEVPEDTSRRRHIIVESDSPSRRARLERLDQAYCKNPDNLPALLERFARENCL